MNNFTFLKYCYCHIINSTLFRSAKKIFLLIYLYTYKFYALWIYHTHLKHIYDEYIRVVIVILVLAVVVVVVVVVVVIVIVENTKFNLNFVFLLLDEKENILNV